MPKRYGVSKYGLNLYSAAMTFETDAFVHAFYTVAVSSSRAAGGRALMVGSYGLSAEARLMLGGRAKPSGIYSLYAEPKFAQQQAGEALIPANFSISATASKLADGYGVLVTGEYTIEMDPFGGNFWDPQLPPGTWNRVPKPTDIWVKQADSAQPWRH